MLIIHKNNHFINIYVNISVAKRINAIALILLNTFKISTWKLLYQFHKAWWDNSVCITGLAILLDP
jgi:hypothetical protein